MINNLKFNLPDGHDEKQFIRQLAGQYSIKKEPAGAERVTICDTFDWRLFNKSLILHSSGNKLFLRKLAKCEILHSVEFSKIPVFIRDFPAGELKEQLAPIIKIRALLQLVELQSRSTPYRILNPDEKTVARLVFEEIRPLRDLSIRRLMAAVRANVRLDMPPAPVLIDADTGELVELQPIDFFNVSQLILNPVFGATGP